MKIYNKKYKFYFITIWIIFLIFLIFVPLYLVFVQKNYFNLFGSLPSTQILENPENDLASELYSADGFLLGKYYTLNRSSVKYDEISENIINALLSTEDLRFKKHSGIDLRGLLRALILSIILRQHKGGGSTISQQLAKNLFNTRSNKYKGKLSVIPFLKTIIFKTKEWIVAVRLEKAYTKKELLSMYLNTVSFGSNTFGIKSASKTFFDKNTENIEISEAALLIGLLKAPTKYSPILNPKNSIKRRNTILGQMLKKKYITQSQYDNYIRKPLNLNYKIDDHKSGIATYFRAVVSQVLNKWAKKNGYNLYRDGLKIYTTLDSKLQKIAEESVGEHMTDLQEKFYKHWKHRNPWINENGKEIDGFLDRSIKKSKLYKALKKQYKDDEDKIKLILNTPRKIKIFTWHGEVMVSMSPIEEISYNKKLLRSSLMAMAPSTGDIKAWVGGINFKYFQFDHVIEMKRQPGSLFKGLVYTAALENGFSPDYKVSDIPITFSLNNKIWTPQNWYKHYTGKKMTLRQALAKSVNSVTAFLIKKLGPQLIVDYAKKLGIYSPLNPVPSICLGTSNVSLYEMLGAYNTFVNKGIWIKPNFITRIEDKYGNVIQNFIPVKKEAISEKTAYLMLYMLKGAQEEKGGSAYNLNELLSKDNDIAAKSGTTQRQTNGWYVVLTQNIALGAWVGGDDVFPIFEDFRNGQSGKTAKPIVVKMLTKIYENEDIGYKKGKFDEINKKYSSDRYLKKYIQKRQSNDEKEEENKNTQEKEDISIDIEKFY